MIERVLTDLAKDVPLRAIAPDIRPLVRSIHGLQKEERKGFVVKGWNGVHVGDRMSHDPERWGGRF